MGVLVSYLTGSIPFAYLAGKARGIDLRKHGSGNLGATNAVRVLGKGIGALVYLGDTLKGTFAALVLPRLIDTPNPGLWSIAFGVAAIVGHVKPIFLLGQGGGKGVATAGGVFLGLAWLPTVISMVLFILTVAITRYVSAGSLVVSVALPVLLLAFRGLTDPLALISCVIGAFVIWMHRANIVRLRHGTEPRIGSRREEPARS